MEIKPMLKSDWVWIDNKKNSLVYEFIENREIKSLNYHDILIVIGYM